MKQLTKDERISMLEKQVDKLKEAVSTVAQAPIEIHSYKNYYDNWEDAEHIDVEYKQICQDVLNELYPEDKI